MNHLFWEAFSAISTCACAVIAIIISLFTLWHSNRRRVKVCIKNTFNIDKVSNDAPLQTHDDFLNNVVIKRYYDIEIQNVGNMPVSVLDFGIINEPEKTNFSYLIFACSDALHLPIKLEAKDLLVFSIGQEEITNAIRDKKCTEVAFYCRTSTQVVKKMLNLATPDDFDISEIRIV